jgi:hypothetical protein
MTTVKAVEILTTLDNEPSVNFFPWEMDVHDVAAGMAKSLHDQGLLSSILTDEQWAAHPGNSVVDQQGNIQVAQRYQLPGQVDINNNMSSVELYVAKTSNDKRQLWIDTEEALKRAVIKSLGHVVRQVIRSTKTRFQQMTVAQIIAKVRSRYGLMQKDTKANLREKMKTMLQTADGLDTHISNLQEMFDISERAGFQVSEDDKVEIFRESICTHPLISKVLETFDLTFPDAKAHAFTQISEYLIAHLPNLKHAQATATRATANMVALTAYSSLEVETKRIKAELEKLKRKRKPDQKPNKLKQKKQNEKRADKVAVKQYCYAHGYQQSHTSAECKVLNGDKKRFTNAMRNSTGPNSPPGGSTRVNGQDVTAARTPRTVTANVAYTIAHDDDADAQSEHDAYDADADDETASFLSQILSESANARSDQGTEPLSGYLSPDYTTTQASAMMLTDELIIMDDKVKSNATEIEIPPMSPIDHTRVCALEASSLAYPTQAVTAAPEAQTVTAGSYPHKKSGESSTSRKGLDLGGGKVVGASDSVNATVPDSGERFSVRLLFPEKNFPTMLYPVHTGMLVSTLRLQISDLLQQTCLVHLLVGVSWKEDRLQHVGTISDRFLPGTTIPCPFPQRGTMMLVYLERPASASPGVSEPVPIGLSSLDSSPALGGWVSEQTRAAIKKVVPQDKQVRSDAPKSDFFDDASRQACGVPR